MKIIFSKSVLGLVLLAVMGFSLAGCATSNVDRENRSERPWNSPTGWEQAGPMAPVLDQQH